MTFSDFVTKSLFAAKPAAGTEAMQIISRKVYHSLFMVLLIGLIPASVLVAACGYLFMDGMVSALLITGGTLYFVGVFLGLWAGTFP